MSDHLSAELKTARMNAIIQMLYLNTVMHTIKLPLDLRDEAVYQNSILPRLEMNRNCFEVQRQAVKRADPSIRPQLLGRALHVVQYNPNLVFLSLSENVPAFVRREEETVGDERRILPLLLDTSEKLRLDASSDTDRAEFLSASLSTKLNSHTTQYPAI